MRQLLNSGQQVVRIGGMAGVGKTVTVAVMARWPGAVACAPTNKAAAVLSAKAGVPVETVHALLYQPFEEVDHGQGCGHGGFSAAKLFEILGQDPAWVGARGVRERRARITAAQPCACPLAPMFMLREGGTLLGQGATVIVDEASMLSGRLYRDLVDTGARLVLCGDYAQLPPVKDTFMALEEHSIDVKLTQVWRQALEGPGGEILRLAYAVRADGRLPPWAKVYQRSEIREKVTAGDVPLMLSHTNRTRVGLNTAARGALWGKDAGPVVIGERLICVGNDKERGLLNGTLWTVDKVVRVRDHDATVSMVGDDGGRFVGKIALEQLAADKPFGRLELAGQGDPFMYGYALTVHKAQGSEARRVRLYLDYMMGRGGREDYARWLYTGVTRAREELRLVRG